MNMNIKRRKPYFVDPATGELSADILYPIKWYASCFRYMRRYYSDPANRYPHCYVSSVLYYLSIGCRFRMVWLQ
jgi:hypothetical protein